MKTGVELIAEERQEQIEKHGFDVTSDAKHYSDEELLQAAVFAVYPGIWTWPENLDPSYAEKIANKPNTIERLKIAGALIAAEIDRIQSIE